MEFYSSIADVYDNIFQGTDDQIEFLNPHLYPGPRTIADLGCATGKLANALAAEGNQVLGMDLDPTMIQKATQEAREQGLSTRFVVGRLEALSLFLKPDTQDLITCFGNTLVHLLSPESIKEVLLEIRSFLVPGGWFLGQIINYDRILDQSISGLPAIDNDKVHFVRKYQLQPPGTGVNSSSAGQSVLIQFEMELTIKPSGPVIKNSIPLLPLRKADLESFFQHAQFRYWEIFADSERHAWRPDSYALYFAVRK